MNTTTSATSFESQHLITQRDSFYGSDVQSSRRESHSESDLYSERFNDEEKAMQLQSEKAKYIAECKRLLSGFRKCQEQPHQQLLSNDFSRESNSVCSKNNLGKFTGQMELQSQGSCQTNIMNIKSEPKDSQKFKFDQNDAESTNLTSTATSNQINNNSLEILEKMIDNWEKLYCTSKTELYNQLSRTENLVEKRRTLDEFFGKLENEELLIKNSNVFRAFKNLHMTDLSNSNQTDNLQLREKDEEDNSARNAQKLIEQRRQQLNEQQSRQKRRNQNKQQENDENQNTQQNLSRQDNQLPSNLFREMQNSTDLSPQKRQSLSGNGKDSFSNENMDPQYRKSLKSSRASVSNNENQENASPQKKSPLKKSPLKKSPLKQSPLKRSPTKRSNLENQENQENLFGKQAMIGQVGFQGKDGKENTQTQQQLRRKKAERNKEVLKTQSQNSNENNQAETLTVAADQSTNLQALSQEALKERQALKETLNKSLFKNSKYHRQQTLTQQQQQELLPPPDITQAITVDSQVINYGKFVCGKILGSTLQLTNTSTQDQIIEISVDNQSAEYKCDEIFGPYHRGELPFDFKDGSVIKNSELDLESWFIENPISKDLVKTLTIRISPQAEKEFIVVLKAPGNRLKYNLASFLVIKHAQSVRRHHSSINTVPSDQQYDVEKRLTKRGSSNDASDIEIELHKTEREKVPEKYIRVMLLGKLENPQIECMRELFHEEVSNKMVPLCVKKSQPQQKFRIPFKNMSLTQDADVEFTFVKLPRGNSQETDNDIDLHQYLEFYCQPSNLKLGMNQQGFLNVLIKVDSSRLSRQVTDEDLIKKPVNKLLVGRLKDTSVVFSYFISIQMVSQ